MNVAPAWQKGYTGAGVVVSILDDGIQTNHPDLFQNYVSIYHSNLFLCTHETRSDEHGRAIWMQFVYEIQFRTLSKTHLLYVCWISCGRDAAIRQKQQTKHTPTAHTTDEIRSRKRGMEINQYFTMRYIQIKVKVMAKIIFYWSQSANDIVWLDFNSSNGTSVYTSVCLYEFLLYYSYSAYSWPKKISTQTNEQHI